LYCKKKKKKAFFFFTAKKRRRPSSFLLQKKEEGLLLFYYKKKKKKAFFFFASNENPSKQALEKLRSLELAMLQQAPSFWSSLLHKLVEKEEYAHSRQSTVISPLRTTTCTIL